MAQVLYILTKGPAESVDLPVPPDGSRGSAISVLLIQDAVALTHVPGHHTYALCDDVATRNVRPSFPTVSYREMLRMIFEADTVVAL